MRTPLDQILLPIRTGYPFRSRIEESLDGNCRLIQARDIQDEKSHVGLNPELLLKVDVPSPVEKYKVINGDVVLMAKGQRNVATLIQGLHESGTSPTIVTNSFYILRAKADRVLPSFLAWSINQPGGQAFLSKIATGSSLKFISSKDLRGMEIDLPSLQTQEKIVSLQNLLADQRQILRQLEDKYFELISLACRKAASDERGEKQN